MKRLTNLIYVVIALGAVAAAAAQPDAPVLAAADLADLSVPMADLVDGFAVELDAH